MERYRLQLALVSVVAAVVLTSCATGPGRDLVSVERVDLQDVARDRSVPVTIYRPTDGKPHSLAILSHGYGGLMTDYRFFAEALVLDGWVVAAPQHDLPGDPPSPSGENLYARRLPFWRNGVRDIDLVIKSLRDRGIVTDSPIGLVGHSNGGDIAMLYASEHPESVRAVISLDNRRYPLPRTHGPRICSIRSADQVADPGVLPSAAEAADFGIAIETIPALKHDDMWDGATEAQKASMLSLVRRCIGRGR